jgi:large repetitive protein
VESMSLAGSTASAVAPVPAATSLASSLTTAPTISQVVIAQSTGRISWNVLDTAGVTSSTLSIDGTAVSGVLGPFTAPSGVNFSAPLGSLADGLHLYTITAVNGAGLSSTLSDSFIIGTAVGPGPTISQATVTVATDTIAWTATDPDGVVSSTLAIDGNSITPVIGPVGTPTTANFSASLGVLSVGSYTYTLTATDTLNNTTTRSGVFTLDSKAGIGPTISPPVVSEARARMSWNALDSTGVTSTTLSIDGTAVSQIAGPFTAPSGVNFSAPLESLAAGSHTYTITAINGLDSSSTLSGTFSLAAPTTYDPMISQVVIAQSRGRISWNVFSPNPIRTSTLQIDGATIGSVIGPFAAPSGVNFSASLAGIAAGSHTYRITATDSLGRQSVVLATLNLTASVGAAQNAVFSNLAASTLDNSAKMAWIHDLGGLTDDLT